MSEEAQPGVASLPPKGDRAHLSSFSGHEFVLPGLVLLVVVLGMSSVASIVTAVPAPSSGAAGSLEAGPTSNSDWPTYLGNVERTSNSTSEQWLTVRNAEQLGPSWNFTAGHTLPNGSAAVYNGIASSTTVVDGLAYFGSWNGYEYALNVTTHKLVWSTYLGVDSFDPKCGGTNNIGVSSAPTVFDGTLYLGGNNVTGGLDAAFYALNSSHGSILWSLSTGNMVEGNYSWASPLLYDGYVYVGLASNCDGPLVTAGLLQINLETNLTEPTHRVIHRFNTMPTVDGRELLGGSIWATPSVDPVSNTVYAVTGNPQFGKLTKSPPNPQNYSESVLALNATTLQLESSWQIPQSELTGSDDDFGSGPAVIHGVQVGGKPETLVVAGNKDGFVYAWNASDVGRGPLWATQTGLTTTEIISPPSYGGGLIYVTTPALKISGTGAPGGLFALYPNNGTVVWEKRLPGRGIGAPLYANGVLVVASGQYVQVFDATSGAMFTEMEAPGAFVSAPSLAEGYVWVGSEDGTEYAMNITSNFTVTFAETGLPLHSLWKVTLTPGHGAPTTLSQSQSPIKFSEPNGTYGYTIGPIPGYRLSTGSYAGSVTVNGADPPVVSVHWTQVTYTVRFNEAGLTRGTNWSVHIDGKTDRLPHTGSSIVFDLPNGTFAFTISAAGFSETSDPSSPLTVDGSTVIVAVEFSPE